MILKNHSMVVLTILMQLGTIGQGLLTMMGFYYVWIQDVHQGFLMFLLAVGSWSLKIQVNERLSKQM